MSVDGFRAARCLLRRYRSRRRAGPSTCVGFGPGERFWGRDRLVGADSRRFARRNQGRLRKRTRSIKPFATQGTPARSSFRAERKRKPPNQKVRRLSFSLFRYLTSQIGSLSRIGCHAHVLHAVEPGEAAHGGLGAFQHRGCWSCSLEDEEEPLPRPSVWSRGEAAQVSGYCVHLQE